ncbi:prepilin-type N-terminal cleavage/methylation domain-containing protein [Allopseudospirillum japonicum]|uniref:Prepilin-type N-terminal cleavage/methylation domain-containing protein n=1 Tax=Allopseudospirillum japonicum TaxID=64971 RepID=A0A1H6SG42_9GAMM|nr:prepilin-type N-terminal cleavage/methylation domain-containing protein [Allopseudospirillum japonicum]SEI66879.1 prepilin-type N-terminal cleavage/methylation domain-containing protein [Allopseudospirillum japonicum]
MYSQQGMTLLEVLIGVLLIGIAAVSWLSLQAVLWQQTSYVYARQQAMNYAQAYIENLYTLDLASLPTKATEQYTNQGIVFSLQAQSHPATSVLYQQVDVQVTWSDAQAQTHQVGLTIYLQAYQPLISATYSNFATQQPQVATLIQNKGY